MMARANRSISIISHIKCNLTCRPARTLRWAVLYILERRHSSAARRATKPTRKHPINGFISLGARIYSIYLNTITPVCGPCDGRHGGGGGAQCLVSGCARACGYGYGVWQSVNVRSGRRYRATLYTAHKWRICGRHCALVVIIFTIYIYILRDAYPPPWWHHLLLCHCVSAPSPVASRGWRIGLSMVRNVCGCNNDLLIVGPGISGSAGHCARFVGLCVYLVAVSARLGCFEWRPNRGGVAKKGIYIC